MPTVTLTIQPNGTPDMPQRPRLRDVTAREIQDMLPDPDTLSVRPIAGKLRRELFRAMQQHDGANLRELCNAVNATAGNIVRDQYFQFAKVLDFPIDEWLAREQAALDSEAEEKRRASRENRVNQTAPARAAKGKLAVATELLESLGYAWHGASNKFVKIPPNWE